jgi:spore coat polysaccharide biosynthesis protein SpsF
MNVKAFIQARMSSSRFPGKSLALLHGKPVIWHVIARAQEALPGEDVVVATSSDPSDDALAEYVHELGVGVFRGPLRNVADRLQACLRAHPCEWFFRVCGDSPLLERGLFRRMLACIEAPDLDLVTNIFPRTFPRGRSLELLAARTFASLDAEGLSPGAQEHVTQAYYEHPEAFRIVNIEAEPSERAQAPVAVDTPEDLARIERMSRDAVHV